MIEVPRIVGTVPDMIKQALDYIKTNVIKKRIIKQKDKAESITFFSYPYQAIEESVVNALYHRDYQKREPVEITILDELKRNGSNLAKIETNEERSCFLIEIPCREGFEGP